MNWTEKPEARYRITRRAGEDLIGIGEYSEIQWGKKQRNRYLKSLEKRFEWLAVNPRAGRQRNDIAHGYYSFPHGQHIVFYLISGQVIDIIGLLHKEMDILLYFQLSE